MALRVLHDGMGTVRGQRRFASGRRASVQDWVLVVSGMLALAAAFAFPILLILMLTGLIG